MYWMRILLILILLYAGNIYSDVVYEIDASPYGTKNAPLPEYIKPPHEKTILVDPAAHAWGAYNASGKLIRWGIATAGADWCHDIKKSCRTKTGIFRIYLLGDASCTSSKFPLPTGGASMPYCMYFNGSEALHGSHDVEFGNASHGCIRVHISDAKWLRYQFVEGPRVTNNFRGTKVIIKNY